MKGYCVAELWTRNLCSFFMYIFGRFLRQTSHDGVSRRQLSPLTIDENAHKCNWAAYVHSWLLDSSTIYKRDKKMIGHGGCLAAIAVLYSYYVLDQDEAIQPNADDGGPDLLSNWESKGVHNMTKYELSRLRNMDKGNVITNIMFI